MNDSHSNSSKSINQWFLWWMWTMWMNSTEGYLIDFFFLYLSYNFDATKVHRPSFKSSPDKCIEYKWHLRNCNWLQNNKLNHIKVLNNSKSKKQKKIGIQLNDIFMIQTLYDYLICCNFEYEWYIAYHLHIRRIFSIVFDSKHSMINQVKFWLQKSLIPTLNAFIAKVSFPHHYQTKMKVEYWCAFIWHCLKLRKKIF